MIVAGSVGLISLLVVVAGYNENNKRLAKEATQKRFQLEAEIRSLEIASRKIKGLEASIKEHSGGCLDELDWLINWGPKNYRQFNLGQKERLMALINHIRSLSQLLKAEVAL